jgi:hypothetical protein
MPNINPNCDGSHCRHGYRKVRLWDLAAISIYACRASLTRTCSGFSAPRRRWVTAEVAFDKHGEPFDAEATLRQGIVNYHQNSNDE